MACLSGELALAIENTTKWCGVIIENHALKYHHSHQAIYDHERYILRCCYLCLIPLSKSIPCFAFAPAADLALYSCYAQRIDINKLFYLKKLDHNVMSKSSYYYDSKPTTYLKRI